MYFTIPFPALPVATADPLTWTLIAPAKFDHATSVEPLATDTEDICVAIPFVTSSVLPPTLLGAPPPPDPASADVIPVTWPYESKVMSCIKFVPLLFTEACDEVSS